MSKITQADPELIATLLQELRAMRERMDELEARATRLQEAITRIGVTVSRLIGGKR